jgi:hypothetical protein
MLPGTPPRRAWDYFRHGTTSLFAASDVRSGKVIGQMHRRKGLWSSASFLIEWMPRFLRTKRCTWFSTIMRGTRDRISGARFSRDGQGRRAAGAVGSPHRVPVHRRVVAAGQREGAAHVLSKKAAVRVAERERFDVLPCRIFTSEAGMTWWSFSTRAATGATTSAPPRACRQLAATLDAAWGGRVARLLAECRTAARLEAALDDLPGWGPVTVRLFLRELPLASRLPVDERALAAAAHLRLIETAGAPRAGANVRCAAGAAGLDARDLEVALVRLRLRHGDMKGCPGGDACTVLAGNP